METKEKLFGRLGGSIGNRISNAGASPKMAAIGHTLLRFAGGFLLSRAVVLEGLTPFGAGWVAASGGGIKGAASLAGAMAGTITLGAPGNLIKNLAILILVYAASVLFSGTNPARHNIFIPAISGAIAAFVGIAVLFGEGFNNENLLFYGTEVILITGSAYFYQPRLNKTHETSGPKNAIGKLVLQSTLLLAVVDIGLFGFLTPARVAAGILVIRAAYINGIGMGSATGLSVGSVMDLSLGYPFFSMSYGISGLLSGIFRKTNKFITTIVYVLTGAITVLWAGTAQLRLSALLETFVVSILFMLIPIAAGKRLHATSSLEEQSERNIESGKRTREFARRRLEQSGLAFQELYTQLQTVFKKKHNDEDIAKVFERTAERVCRKCENRGGCFGRDMENTYSVFGDISRVLNREGKVVETDFPEYFSGKCSKLAQFVHAANEEMTNLLNRRKYNAGLQESRAQICQQYAEIAKTLGHIAEQVGREISFDEAAEHRISKALEPYRLQLSVAVLTTPEGQRRIEIEGRGAGLLMGKDRHAEFMKTLASCAGYSISMPEHVITPLGEKLIFTEAERLKATIGVASHKKQGEAVSGDYGTWFKTADGNAYIILSDGMGSGKEAGESAARLVGLLERFIRAGIDPASALNTINSTLILRGAEGCEALVTVDLCVVSLKTGLAKFFKNGASPSYIKRGGGLSRVVGQGWPIGVGLSPGLGSGATGVKLIEGDMVILASDGVCGNGDDEWLEKFIVSSEDTRPKELAGRILEQAVLQSGRGDDMMVMVFAL